VIEMHQVFVGVWYGKFWVKRRLFHSCTDRHSSGLLAHECADLGTGEAAFAPMVDLARGVQSSRACTRLDSGRMALPGGKRIDIVLQ